MIEAIGARDYPLAQGCVLMFALTYVLVNVATDMAYSLIDPRVRLDVIRNFSLAAGGVIVAALLMLAVAGPGLDAADPLAINLDHALAGPSGAHPLGCDALGRDMLARTVWGARISVGIAAAVVGVSLVIGSLIGGAAALAGGWIDELLMRVVDILLAFPGILLAIALAAILGPGLVDLVIALAAMGWTGYARLVRGEILSLRERDYVQAARSLGATPARLLLRHLLPAVADRSPSRPVSESAASSSRRRRCHSSDWGFRRRSPPGAGCSTKAAPFCWSRRI